MQHMVVLSGKGGTGKTTVVGALAALWQKLILVDCDVDASNLHLITRPEIREEHSFKGTRKASIDVTGCNGCGICLDYCRFDAIHQHPELVSDADAGYRVDQLACEGCGLCSHTCPEQAIAMLPVETGVWYRSDTPFGPLVHGRLAPAQGNSGRLVTLLRSKAGELAAAGDFDLTLIDGPPGIGCPTIASLTGTDYALIVTEPSLSAFHDLRRISSLISHFEVPAGIVINKSDINSDISKNIEDFAHSEGIRLLERLTYDRSVSRAQLGRQTAVEYCRNGFTDQLRSLRERLRMELEQLESRKSIGAK
jgi:MinD superfamily P-loop ATPase